MAIKSPQTLVSEALNEVKTITPDEAMKLNSENKCNLIASSGDMVFTSFKASATRVCGDLMLIIL